MKVTIEQIQSKIKNETYIVLPDGKSTLCILNLENGYSIKGLSACVDPADFDLNLGRKYAYEDAIRQIWPLEGYLLAQQMYESSLTVADLDKAVEQWSASMVGDKIVVKEQEKRTARVRKLAADAEAPYGYKKDGTPKKAPGRRSKQ